MLQRFSITYKLHKLVCNSCTCMHRKMYNILVPALFDGQPIQPNEPLDSSMRRKIQKLQEYVQMSPAKIPKVQPPGLQAGRASANHVHILQHCNNSYCHEGQPKCGWLLCIQVSRRLMRRIRAVMRKPGTEDLGHVKVRLAGFG